MKNLSRLLCKFVILLLAVPILLNFVLMIPSPLSKWIIGSPNDWLSFWGNYIGAIGTFVMAVIAFVTIKQNDQLVEQNKDQLDELKRQWKEQNSPKLSCSLGINRNSVFLEIKNISSVSAHNVTISIETNMQNNDIYDFEEWCTRLNSMTFEIPPLGKKQITINGIEPSKSKEYKDILKVTLSYDDKKENFNLYLNEIVTTEWEYTMTNLCQSIDDIESSVRKISDMFN